MARVPVVQGNGIERQGITGARIRPADNDGGVLGGLGKGMQGLGSAGVEFADNQVKLAENRVKDLDLQYATAAAQIRAQYGSLEGKSAVTARPDTEKALKDLRDKLYGEAKGVEQKMFANSVDRRWAGDLSDIRIHYDKQFKVYGEGLAGDRRDMAETDAIGSVGTPAFDEHIQTGYREIESLNASKGLSPEREALEKRKFLTGVHAGVIRTKLAVNDVDGARAHLEEYKNEIDWKEEAALREALQPALERREQSADADGIIGMASQDDSPPVQYGDPLRGGGTGVSDGYGVARGGGKTHNGVDFTAPKGTPIYSIAPGRVVKVSSDPRSGNFVVIDHGNGMTSSYSHMDGHKVEVGDEVTPDTRLGGVGMTGNTRGPHLHMVVKQNGQTVDPQQVVGKARQNPREHDLTELLARVDAKADRENWSFERRDRAKSEVERRVGRDEKLLSREQEDAATEALDVVDGLGDRFTSMTQIPSAILARMSSKARISLRARAENNAKPREPAANPDLYWRLSQAAVNDPAGFARLDLRQYAHELPKGDWEQFNTLQRAAAKGPASPAMVAHSRIIGVTADLMRLQGLDPGNTKEGNKPANVEKRAAYVAGMSKQVAAWQAINGKDKQPSDDDLKRMGRNLLLSVDDKPVYAMDDAEIGRRIADKDRARATAALRANGLPITERNIVEIYRRTLAIGGYGN